MEVICNERAQIIRIQIDNDSEKEEAYNEFYL